MYNQVPLLEMDGMNMVQTFAIVNFIAAKYGLNGNGPEEQYRFLNTTDTPSVHFKFYYFRIDLMSEGLRDFYVPFFAYTFVPNETFFPAITTNLNKYMPIFEKA
jgi:glutathione S-transferase